MRVAADSGVCPADQGELEVPGLAAENQEELSECDRPEGAGSAKLEEEILRLPGKHQGTAMQRIGDTAEDQVQRVDDCTDGERSTLPANEEAVQREESGTEGKGVS